MWKAIRILWLGIILPLLFAVPTSVQAQATERPFRATGETQATAGGPIIGTFIGQGQFTVITFTFACTSFSAAGTGTQGNTCNWSNGVAPFLCNAVIAFFRITAKTGETIDGSAHGANCLSGLTTSPQDSPLGFTFGMYRFTGGTGRFSSVKGLGTFVGTTDRTTGAFQFVLDGTITF